MSKVVLCREFTVNIVSATNVEDVRMFRRSKLFAKVTVGNMEAKTNTDEKNETNPQWNSSFKFPVPVNYIYAANSALNLEMEICLDSILRDNQRVGYAKQNIHKLFVDGFNNIRQGIMTMLTLPLKTDSGLIKGEVGLGYYFGEEKNIAARAAIMSKTGVFEAQENVAEFTIEESIANSAEFTSGESIAYSAEFTSGESTAYMAESTSGECIANNEELVVEEEEEDYFEEEC